MSPNEYRETVACPCCGRLVIRIYNAATGSSIPHMCNSIVADGNPYLDTKPVVKATFKNSQFFNKHRKTNERK